MEKQVLIELTKTVYHLTLLFPKKEPLRYKIREVADNILESFILLKNPMFINLLSQQLEVLDSFFEVAKAQNWVKSAEIVEIQRKYSDLRKELGKNNLEKLRNDVFLKITPDFNVPKNTDALMSDKNNPLLQINKGVITKKALERQERILDFLREQGRAQVWQIKQILPEVTKRTLRRDFEALVKKGLIERMGEKNKTFYQIKIS